MNEPRLPPLTALRALEACSRLRSFARAAEELGVTPGAVTQHIRTIEDWVGTPLFRRTGREVLLTELLEEALPTLREGFDRLAETGRILRSGGRSGRVVSLSAPPSFASKWLLPRLDRFREMHPSIEVWVSADMQLVDFLNTNVDLAIRYGGGAYDGLVAEKLLEETVLPVASPALAEKLGFGDNPDRLLGAPLLHDASDEGDPSCPDWPMWFQARNVRGAETRIGPRYNQSSLVIEEAVAGKGIALARRVIAEMDLDAGRLVPLLPDETRLAFAYWLVWPRGRTLRAPVRAFISWLMSETAKDGLPRPHDPGIMSGA
ncbi:LysR substrate-binding domain-containing protein [Sphingobium lignivorans]|uniref:LysR family glycine cleavage system transcriptional activator n=1 Tax=Sphingobium lignivorans TaxID=2735886 RepID=A0ABR6NH49_9SPHN|nr:LysR substrate-binding domain-containing protein [Sphingobium lignivorans]MBB5986613.1 LysR family glycine cleavage system transcriptional activator [Sphingobium lignivorans]